MSIQIRTIYSEQVSTKPLVLVPVNSGQKMLKFESSGPGLMVFINLVRYFKLTNPLLQQTNEPLKYLVGILRK